MSAQEFNETVPLPGRMFDRRTVLRGASASVLAVAFGAAGAASASAAGSASYRVTKNANVRSKPKGTVVGTLAAGTIITASTGTSSGYRQIQSGGSAGRWISTSLTALASGGGSAPAATAGVYRGSLHPLGQKNTGPASGANCGPTTAVMVLLNLGIHPAGWTGNDSKNAAAVKDFRRRCGIANTPSRNRIGTEWFELCPGLGTYGVRTNGQASIDDVLAAAREGRPSISGGDRFKFPWTKGSGSSSHWVAVLGYTNGLYVVCDPAYSGKVRYVSEGTMRDFASTNPGYYPGHPRLQPPHKNHIVTL